MPVKINEEDYIYASSRIRAYSNTTSIGTDRLKRIADAKNAGELKRLLDECGVPSEGDTESILSKMLSDSYKLVASIAPQPELFDILRCQYDCHNIKAALKCRFMNIDPAPLMLESGIVPPEKVIAAVSSGDYFQLPGKFADGAKAAAEAYAKTSNPQLIDVALDRACFFEMTGLSQKYNIPYFSSLVKIKEDTTNILTCIRLMRMKSEAIDFAYFQSMMLPEGDLKADFFRAAFAEENGEEYLSQELAKTAYSPLANRLMFDGLSLTEIEKACENYYVEAADKAKEMLYGAPVLARYLIIREFEIKNLRIALSGKRAGIAPDMIKERFRGLVNV